ncbi:MAG: universal stress protein [Actinomycetes bacterium]
MKITTSMIVVGVDGSPESVAAYRFAQHELAQGDRYKSILIVASLTDPLGLGNDDAVDDARAAAMRQHIVEAVGESDLQIEVRSGDPAHVLAEVSDDAGLLVIGKRGHGGFRSLVLGSTASSCLGIAKCPVMVIPSTFENSLTSELVVGIDGSLSSHRALAWAIEEAAGRSVNVELVATWRRPHLWEPVQGSPGHYEALADHALEDAMSSLDSKGVLVATHSIEGHPSEVLLSRSETAGLIVLGNEAHKGGRIHAHATAVEIASHSVCPVVVVP